MSIKLSDLEDLLTMEAIPELVYDRVISMSTEDLKTALKKSGLSASKKKIVKSELDYRARAEAVMKDGKKTNWKAYFNSAMDRDAFYEEWEGVCKHLHYIKTEKKVLRPSWAHRRVASGMRFYPDNETEKEKKVPDKFKAVDFSKYNETVRKAVTTEIPKDGDTKYSRFLAGMETGDLKRAQLLLEIYDSNNYAIPFIRGEIGSRLMGKAPGVCEKKTDEWVEWFKSQWTETTALLTAHI